MEWKSDLDYDKLVYFKKHKSSYTWTEYVSKKPIAIYTQESINTNQCMYPDVILIRRKDKRVIRLTEGNAYWSENSTDLPWKIIHGRWIKEGSIFTLNSFI